MEFNYHIGEYYKYPDSSKRYKLICVTGFLFEFECGHWCTDTIFVDLIRVKTGIPVNEDVQMEIFINYR